jgi:hypothetical protein
MPARRRQSLELSDRCRQSGGANLHKSVVLVSSRLRGGAHFCAPSAKILFSQARNPAGSPPNAAELVLRCSGKCLRHRRFSGPVARTWGGRGGSRDRAATTWNCDVGGHERGPAAAPASSDVHETATKFQTRPTTGGCARLQSARGTRKDGPDLHWSSAAGAAGYGAGHEPALLTRIGDRERSRAIVGDKRPGSTPGHLAL